MLQKPEQSADTDKPPGSFNPRILNSVYLYMQAIGKWRIFCFLWKVTHGRFTCVLVMETCVLTNQSACSLQGCFLRLPCVLHFRQAGAVGSRLTGAGWGGCTVSLVPAAAVNDFMRTVQDGYYAADPERLNRVAESLFATQPGSGAAILNLN